MSQKIIPTFFAVIFIFQSVSAVDKIVCYYESWMSYNGVNPEDLDASLCTHMNYAFIGLSTDGNLVVEDPDLDVGEGLFQRLVDMKQRNSNLKIMLSIGGASASAASTFSAVAANADARRTLIEASKYYFRTYGFDGIDIDWEYPYGNDRENYITLLREIKNDFNQYGYLLTVAVAANPEEGYDARQMSEILDWINIMTYDMYGEWSEYTGQNSALYASSVESQWEKENLNIAACSQNWVNAGASPSKLVIGVAFYGRTFRLADPSQNWIHAPITGVGVGDGYVNYIDVCTTYGSWERMWDDEQKNPIKISGDQWIGYDDPDSIWIKADYIKEHNFAGVMMWAIDGDDIHGQCGRKQDMLHNINTVFWG